MFRRKLTLKFIFLMLLTLSASLASSAELTFVGQDYPPYIWQEKEKVVGLFPEIATEICKKIKFQCSFQIMTLKRATIEAEEGKIDGLMAVAKNPEREKFATYTSVVVRTGKAYFGEKENFKGAHQVADLKDSVVVTVRDSSSSKLAKKDQAKAPTLKVEEEIDNPMIIKKMMAGRYGPRGLILGNQDVITYLLNQNHADKISKLFQVEDEEYYFAFSKKKVAEADFQAFNKALHEFQNSGGLKAILNKYGAGSEK